MFDKIARNDMIFQLPDFLKDAFAFNVMITIVEDTKTYPEIKLFSNHTNCIVVNSDKEHPVIIWTTDDFCDFENLFKFLKKEFMRNYPFKIISKIKPYEFLQSKCKNVYKVGVYHCDTLQAITYVGHADHIHPDEIEIVADMLRDFGYETGTDTKATQESVLPLAQKFLDDPLHLIWRDTNGKIVSLCRVRETQKYGRPGHIITRPEERGKAYAKMLLHFVTKRIFEIGKTPMLFTDYNYPSSNKCYPKVGYILDDIVMEYELTID